MAEVVVRGLAQLNKLLQELPVKLERNVVRGALRAGAMVIQKQAKANAPVGKPPGRSARLYGLYPGALRDSIRVSVRTSRGTVIASVKAGGKIKKSGVVVFHAGWVEFGTKPHLISVAENERPINLGLTSKLGVLTRVSMTTINRRIRSLLIGSNFVGPTVSHPGATARPYLRPALDTQATNAVIAAAEYMKKRLATKEGLNTADIVIEAE